MIPASTLQTDSRQQLAWEPLHRLFAKAILIRSVEERMLQLFSDGEFQGTVHTCIGQEWTGIAVSEFLKQDDYVFSNHRCHGHYLSRTDDVEGLIAEVMGRASGVCGGFGGSQHLCKERFFSNGIQGGIVPVAAGLALSQKLQKKNNIAVVFIGDGTLGEGAVYETLNLISKWQLPLLIVLENNGYSQSTRQCETLAGDICSRAEAFGIQTFQADTWHPDQLLQVTEKAIERVRNDQYPVFLSVDTYRLASHSKGDDDRDPEELKKYWASDPISRYSKVWPEEADKAHSKVQQRIEEAVLQARRSELPKLKHNTFNDAINNSKQLCWKPCEPGDNSRVVASIRNALDRALDKHPELFLIGEDIESPYGGAFKVTQGLSTRFEGRVRNMPIGESLIVGLGNGLALSGMKPVCEIMFGDFLMLAADQIINHASKFKGMYNDQVRVPLIIRTPMGGRRGYGPTHSQSIEKHFLGIPDLTVLAINHRLNPGEMYDRLFNINESPVLVVENKRLYGMRLSANFPDGFVFEQTEEDYPTLRIRPEGKADITIVCYGEMLVHAESAILKAFDESEIIGEIICPTRLSPLDPSPIIESLNQSGRLLVVEEGIGVAGFGSELITLIATNNCEKTYKYSRLCAVPIPIPANADLENEILPDADSIFARIKEIVGDV